MNNKRGSTFRRRVSMAAVALQHRLPGGGRSTTMVDKAKSAAQQHQQQQQQEEGEEEEEEEEEESFDEGYGAEDTQHVAAPKSVAEYLAYLRVVRGAIEDAGLVPLFHFTQRPLAGLICSSGLRMSKQGQGDGGVYFSTFSPASYGLGQPDYEKNLIIDCFGKERLEEYRGKHKLDLVLIYGMHPSIIQQAPGGRHNAKVVGKATFENITLPSPVAGNGDAFYFLRADRIFGALEVDPAVFREDTTSSSPFSSPGDDTMAREARRDDQTREQLAAAQQRLEAIDEAIMSATVHVSATQEGSFSPRRRGKRSSVEDGNDGGGGNDGDNNDNDRGPENKEDFEVALGIDDDMDFPEYMTGGGMYYGSDDNHEVEEKWQGFGMETKLEREAAHPLHRPNGVAGVSFNDSAVSFESGTMV